ncbi:MAG: hypothetical protein ABIS06_18695 [Vicinamibacterales bacterium]
MKRWRAHLWLVLALVSLHHSAPAASNRYDPRLRFRTISTARFDIHFHQGEDDLARRLAAIAELVATELEPSLGKPQQRVTVILVDQTDLSNGWATPTPFDLIEIAAVPPHSGSAIGNTSDWLRIVFTHEYTHVLHLERAGGWIGRGRRVFGRLPFLHPNLFLPVSQIEGLAVFQESRRTGQGRIPSGDFRLVVAQGAASGRFEPLDRATLAPVDWPSGSLPYAYGAYFIQYLADTYGEASLTALADATASRLPYFGSRAFEKVYKKSLGELWTDFKGDTAKRSVPAPSDAKRLTHHGYYVSGPRFSSDGRLFYSLSDAHDFPSLMELTSDGPREVTRRVLGSRTAPAGKDLVFDQVEVVRSVAILSDLYTIPQDGGDPRALTRQARAVDPDVSPDGRTIVCAVQQTGRRILATMPLVTATPFTVLAPLVDEPSTEFSLPQWSPDGRQIAAERRRLGGPSEIVIIDVASRSVRVLSASAHGRSAAPAWMPDGRAILFASDRDGGAFGLYRISADGSDLRKATNAGSSAEFPTISMDGSRVVFVGYTVDGYDLFELAAANVKWTEITQAPVRAQPSDVAQPFTAASSTTYTPWRTLAPRFWFPIIEEDDDKLAYGAGTAGTDALGRHTYFASAAWSSTLRPDWNLAYAYDRWRPTMFADFSDSSDQWRVGTVAVRELNAGAIVPFRKFRQSHALFGAFHAASEQFDCAECERPVDARIDRRAIRAAWQFTAAHAYAYSISREQGWNATLASEWTIEGLGSSGDATSVVADVRGYLRAWPRHGVIAARAAVAAASGDDSVRRVFSAAGSDAQPVGVGFSFDAIGLMRGFDPSDVAGRRAAVFNADYRFPLRWIERGLGTWPVFLRSLHGAVFIDHAAAWETSLRSHDWRTSIGGELSADVVLGYWVPLTLASGIAWRHDPAHAVKGATAFFRIGRAF